MLRLVHKKSVYGVGLNDEEESYFPRLLAYAVLSLGSYPIKFVTKDGRATSWHIYEFALAMKSVRGKEVILTDGTSGRNYRVNISDLWTFLEKELKHVYPYALQEALHISREAPVYEMPSSFTFSSEKSIR